jgi:hypothetical protein
MEEELVIREKFPCVFMRDSVGTAWFVWALALSILFFLSSNIGFRPLSIAEADSIAALLGRPFPGVLENYEIMKGVGRETDAVLYALLFPSMFALAVFVFVVVLRRYFRERAEIKFPDPVLDWLVFAVALGMTWWLTTISLECRAGSRFCLDPAGLFLITQGMVLSLFCYAAMVLLISLLRAFDRVGRGSRPV